MSYDFPASPTPGQEYTPPVGGQTYIWQPPRWLVKGIPPAGGGGGGGIDEAPTDGKQYGRASAAWSEVIANPTWTTLTGKPATFPPTLPIAQADVTGLVAGQSAQDTAISGKAATVHTHAQADVTNLVSDLGLKAPLASPAFTGTPTTATTPTAGDSTTKLATTAFVATSFAPIAAPVFTGDARAVTPATADNDTSVATTAFVRSALTTYGATATAQTYNRVINPQFFIDQGASGAITISGHFADQWLMYSIHSAGTTTAQLVATAAPTALGGATFCGRITITAADAALAAGEVLAFLQTFEGYRMADLAWGTAAAKQVILRFSFKGPAGTYAFAFNSSTEGRVYVKNFVISAGQANTYTTQTFVVPGDTTVGSTWVTSNLGWGYFYICLAAGSTFTGTDGAWQTGPKYGVTGMTNGMGTAGSVFEITDVGIYADPQATGVAPPFEPTPYDADLRTCQRYWQTIDQNGIGWNGYVASSLSYVAKTYLPVAMRANPTATGTNSIATGFPATVGTLAANYVSVAEIRVANTTGDAKAFASNITLNARM